MKVLPLKEVPHFGQNFRPRETDRYVCVDCNTLFPDWTLFSIRRIILQGLKYLKLSGCYHRGTCLIDRWLPGNCSCPSSATEASRQKHFPLIKSWLLEVWIYFDDILIQNWRPNIIFDGVWWSLDRYRALFDHGVSYIFWKLWPTAFRFRFPKVNLGKVYISQVYFSQTSR